MNGGIIAYRNRWTMAFCHPTMSLRRFAILNSRTSKQQPSNKSACPSWDYNLFLCKKKFAAKEFHVRRKRLTNPSKTNSRSEKCVQETNITWGRKEMVTSPSRTVSRPRLKPLPCRPHPLITVGTSGELRVLCTHGSLDIILNKRPQVSTQIINRREREWEINGWKESRECAFRLQWRHSSRFIKCFCFVSLLKKFKKKWKKIKEKRLEGEW
jgi:hypothetical protein